MKRAGTVTTAAAALTVPALASETPVAEGHVPKKEACVRIWEDAPVGSKWRAKQRCLAMQWRHRCVTHRRVVPGTVTVKGLKLARGGRGYSKHWRNQRKVIAWFVNEGIRRRLPRKLIVTAVATTTQESSARELSQTTSFSGTSLGPLQLIDIHGTRAQRISVKFSGTWFYNGIVRTHRKYPRLSVVELAHTQQRSRYPAAVEKHVREATRTVRIVGGTCVA